MEKKKSSYDAKKEKLIEIKIQLEAYYEIYGENYKIEMDPKIMTADICVMRMMLDLIWEIVKDEKAK